MEEIYKNVLAETSFILKHFDKSMYNKIPENILEIIEKNKNENYEINYDFNKTLENQKLNKETFALISVLYLKFCVDEEKRKELLKICCENDIKEEELLRKKFDIENIFKNPTQKIESKDTNIENKDIIPRKESIISKIITFIKNIFIKK